MLQVPPQQLLDPYGLESGNASSSSSCPAAFRKEPMPSFLSQDEEKAWFKERQKKDNHNMSEYNVVEMLEVLLGTFLGAYLQE